MVLTCYHYLESQTIACCSIASLRAWACWIDSRVLVTGKEDSGAEVGEGRWLKPTTTVLIQHHRHHVTRVNRSNARAHLLVNNKSTKFSSPNFLVRSVRPSSVVRWTSLSVAVSTFPLDQNSPLFVSTFPLDQDSSLRQTSPRPGL